MSRYQDYFNAKTGEEATGMLIIRGSRYPKGMHFTTVFMDGLIYLAKLGLSSTEHRVLLALFGNMAFANFLRVSQKAIATELGVAPSNVSVAIKRLIQLRLIAKQEDPEEPGRSLLRVSLHLAWRGTAKDWSTAMTQGEGTAFAPIPVRLPKRKSKPSKSSDCEPAPISQVCSGAELLAA